MNFTKSFLKNHKSFSKREKVLLVVFLALVGSYLLYSLYFKAQITELKGLQAELDQAQNTVTTALAQGWDNLPQIQEQIHAVKQQQEQLYSIIPPVKDTPGLLEEIYQLTTEYDLRVPKPISFSELQKQDNYAAYTINISVAGRREAVYLFIHELETLNRLIEVKKSVLQAESSDYLTADLELAVYVLENGYPDPSDYPFMEFKKDNRKPYEIFQPISGAEPAVLGESSGSEFPLPEAPNALPSGNSNPEENNGNNGASVPVGNTYQVVAGDTLKVIANNLFGNPDFWPVLAEANHLSPPYDLEIGQELRLPDNTYTVQPGDTLYLIALKIYGSNHQWKIIAEANNLVYPYSLAVGQKLLLPMNK